jgi:hypothetical protein
VVTGWEVLGSDLSRDNWYHSTGVFWLAWGLPGKCPDNISIRPRSFRSKFLEINHFTNHPKTGDIQSRYLKGHNPNHENLKFQIFVLLNDDFRRQISILDCVRTVNNGGWVYVERRSSDQL